MARMDGEPRWVEAMGNCIFTTLETWPSHESPSGPICNALWRACRVVQLKELFPLQTQLLQLDDACSGPRVLFGCTMTIPRTVFSPIALAFSPNANFYCMVQEWRHSQEITDCIYSQVCPMILSSFALPKLSLLLQSGRPGLCRCPL